MKAFFPKTFSYRKSWFLYDIITQKILIRPWKSIQKCLSNFLYSIFSNPEYTKLWPIFSQKKPKIKISAPKFKQT